MSWLGELAARLRGTSEVESADAARARVEACLRDEVVPALESAADAGSISAVRPRWPGMRCTRCSNQMRY